MKYISKGAIHLHSLYSDGTGTIEQIAREAKIAGLDWIVITDHNTLSGLKNGQEGWHDGVAVIIGNEISPNFSNHYIAVGITEEIPADLPAKDVIEQVRSQGGIGFIAHPDESYNRKNKYPPLRWEDWTIRGFDGIEIWNYMSDWTDNYNEKARVFCALRRHYRIKGPTANTLRWWDEINNETRHIVSAIGGLDTHAFDFGVFKIFPYLDSFKTITNYLFLNEKLSLDFNKAKEQVIKGLKVGSNIIVNRRWNKKDDSELNFIFENAKIVVKIPQKANIKLFRNGELVLEKITSTLEFIDPLPGKYRFEAYYREKPWIFSNPIVV